MTLTIKMTLAKFACPMVNEPQIVSDDLGSPSDWQRLSAETLDDADHKEPYNLKKDSSRGAASLNQPSYAAVDSVIIGL